MATVVITGANRGIGLEFARQYAADGWRVHACCRAPERAAELVAALKGRDGVVHRLDVTDQAQLHDLAGAIDDEPVDVLVNNAGAGGGDAQAFGTVDYGAWERTIRTNVFGPYRVAEALADRVAAGSRRVIANISSRMGSIGDNGSGGSYVYRSSKTALNMVVVNLAHDLAGHDIAVLALHPGWVRTDMGGSNAPVAPEESVGGMRALIERAGPAESGRFFNYDGTPLPW